MLGSAYKDTSKYFELQIEDRTGTGIAGSGMDSLKLTIKDLETGTVINSRNAATIATSNVSSGGLLTFTLTRDDNVFHDTTKQEETHWIMWEWEHTSSADRGVWWDTYKVKQPGPVTP